MKRYEGNLQISKYCMPAWSSITSGLTSRNLKASQDFDINNKKFEQKKPWLANTDMYGCDLDRLNPNPRAAAQ